MSVEVRGARPLVLGSQVESRDAATTDVAAIDHCITYDDFCDAHELLFVLAEIEAAEAKWAVGTAAVVEEEEMCDDDWRSEI